MLRNLNLRTLWALLALVSWTTFAGQQVWGAAAAAAGGGIEGGLDAGGRLTRVSAIKILPYDPWDGIVATEAQRTVAVAIASAAAGGPAGTVAAEHPEHPKHLGSKDTGADGVEAANGHIAFGEYKDPFGFDPVVKFTRVDGALRAELGKPQNAQYMSADEIGEGQFDWGEWELGADGNWVPHVPSVTSPPSSGAGAGSPRRATYKGYKPGTHGDYLQRLVKHKNEVAPMITGKDGSLIRGENLLLVRMLIRLHKQNKVDGHYNDDGVELCKEFIFGVYCSGECHLEKPKDDCLGVFPKSVGVLTLPMQTYLERTGLRDFYCSGGLVSKKSFQVRVEDPFLRLGLLGTDKRPNGSANAQTDFEFFRSFFLARFSHPDLWSFEDNEFYTKIFGSDKLFGDLSRKVPAFISARVERFSVRDDSIGKFYENLKTCFFQSEQVFMRRLLGRTLLEDLAERGATSNHGNSVGALLASHGEVSESDWRGKKIDPGYYKFVGAEFFLYSTYDVCRYCRGTMSCLHEKGDMLGSIIQGLTASWGITVINNEELINDRINIFAFSCYDTDT